MVSQPTHDASPPDVTNENDASIRKRIIKHMNVHHPLEMSHYLRHFAHLSEPQAWSPEMTDMDFSSMTIKDAAGKAHQIPLDPPMTSWSETRSRAADMDIVSRSSLGINTVVIKEYVPPGIVGMIFLEFVLLAFSSMLLQSYIVPGNFYHDTILPYFPGGPDTYLYIQRLVRWPAIGIHVVEAAVMAWRLQMSSTEVASEPWVKWLLSALFEGTPAHLRFSGLVAKRRLEVEKVTRKQKSR